MQRIQPSLLLLAVIVGSFCCLLTAAQRRPAVWPPVAFKALSRQAESGVAGALRSQLGQLATPLPRDVVCPSCLMVAPQTQAQLFQGSMARTQLQAAVRSHGLPQEVANRLAALAFARSVSFHTFTFSVSTLVGRGHYETYIGAGRRLDDINVEFGVFRSVASAQLVAKTTPVPRRSCKRRFFIKRCRSWTEQVPRGLTADELRLLEAGLRHFAIGAAASRLPAGSAMLRSRRYAESAAEEEFDEQVPDDSEQPVPTTTIAPTSETVSNNADQNATLVELVRTGFDRLAISATSQTLRRIPVSMASAFAALFARSLGLPASLAGPLRDAVVDAALAAAPADGSAKQRRLSLLFNTEEDPEAIRFVQLGLVRRQSSFDLTSASVRLEARWADRLQVLISQAGDDGEEIRIRRLPARVGPEELRAALRLLRAAAEGRLSGKLQPPALPSGGSSNF